MIKNIQKRNNKVTIDSIRKEKMKDFLEHFTDANGNVDIENIKTYIEENGNKTIKEGYSLNFLGKRASELLSSLESTTVFVPDKEHNSKEENKNSENIYISADNLEALRHLKNSYHNKIKCIYIDPPYNTGNDGFCYNDKFGYDKEVLSEKLGINIDEAERILSMQSTKSNSHSAWLSFMYARLLLAQDLLTNDGVMFINIDENEDCNLQLLCKELFGDENVDTIIWQKMDARYDQNTNAKVINRFKSVHEYIIICYKNKKETLFGKMMRLPDWSREQKNVDNDPRGNWQSGIISYEEGHENEDTTSPFYYIVKSPSGVEWKRQWFVDKNEMQRLIEDNRIYFGSKPEYKNVPRLKTFENEEKLYYMDSILRGVGTSSSAKKEIEEIFDGKKIFDTPKPLKLVKECIRIASNENDIILDFFAGSSTTAHAVLDLNTISGKRKYILCQLPEIIDEESKNIDKEILNNQIELCNTLNKKHAVDTIGIERVIRAGKQIKEKSKNNIDYGFKHYTLIDKSETLDKLESFDPNMAIISQDSILSEFSPESRLITFLCDDGFGLTAKYDEIDLNGYKAYFINGFLYLLDKGFDSTQIAYLIEKVDKNEIKLKKIEVFGYAFDTRSLQQLKDNAEKIGIDGDKDIIIKY